jgi:hypothetical protein
MRNPSNGEPMMHAYTSVPFALTAALALAAGLAFAEARTPLGKWMQPNIEVPKLDEDFAALVKGFDIVASKPPPGDYPKWVSIAKAGSAAAAKRDLRGVKATCDDCHKPYREKYRREFPTRPFP